MKIAIWGAGKRGIWFSNLVSKLNAPFEVICFGDNNKSIIGTIQEGLSVVSANAVLDFYKENKIDRVVILTEDTHTENIIQQLKDMEELYMVPSWIHFSQLTVSEIEQYMIKVDARKPRIDYIEYHVCDHCNLNCKGCGHLCPLVKEEVFGDLKQYTRDLKRLKELIWGIKTIRLMGGEPLLNPQLPEFISITREIFPDAKISVVTNGLLFHKASVSLLETLKRNRCGLDVSLYPPTKKIAEKIERICQEQEIKYHFSEEVIEFFKRKTLEGNENIEESYKMCDSKNCHFLKDGKLSICAIPLLIEKFNDTYGADFQVASDDIIDIHDKKLDGLMLAKRLREPIQMCRYCKSEPKYFAWQIADENPEKDDWLVD